MSSVLGVISLSSLGLALYQTFQAKGQAGFNMGVVGFLSALYALIGITLGYLGKMEQDRFSLFAYIGLFLNLISLMCISVILYAGAYGW